MLLTSLKLKHKDNTAQESHFIQFFHKWSVYIVTVLHSTKMILETPVDCCYPYTVEVVESVGFGCRRTILQW